MNEPMGDIGGEAASGARRSVVVLLATFNGMRWLPEQIESILQQQKVRVRIVISDDMSSDGTWEWVQDLASSDSRVRLLPRGRRYGSAAANFYRLLMDAEIRPAEWIAFSDQDDIWQPEKLFGQIDLLQSLDLDGVSSDVTAFWDDGKTVEIIKSQPQRAYDYIFESPGPGCTFLMSFRLVDELRRLLSDEHSCAREVALHDWLAYAVCRASGWKWHIERRSTVRYRQHQSNEFGASIGLAAKVTRARKLRDGWYRHEVAKLLRICSAINPDRRLLWMLLLLEHFNFMNRIRFLSCIGQTRRRLSDRLFLSLAVIAYWL